MVAFRFSGTTRLIVAASAALTLAGCAGSSLPKLPKIKDLNPFKEEKKPLPGKRIAVTPASSRVGGLNLENAKRPVQLPPAAMNASWSQPGGTPSNAPGHLTFEGAGRRVWAARIGNGSSGRARLLASPVVQDGKVFVMDATSVVSAFGASSGRRLWSTKLVPENERASEAFGGGIAVGQGRLFAATGFGTVVALDLNSGKKLWEKSLGVPLRASPTVANGQVFVVATDGRAFNLNVSDGAQLWSFRGLPQRTGLLFNPSPAAANGYVVLPYPNGDVVAVKAAEGLSAWSDSVASTRTTSLGAMSDASRPVVSNGRVYAVGHSGRMIASDLKSGERLWTANIAGIQPPAVAGTNVFVVDVSGRLVSLNAATGNAHWSMQLPGSRTWAGPVIASNRLWLASATGQLVGIDARTGKLETSLKVGEPVFLAPVVAGGMLFVLTDKGRLIAYR